MTSTTHLGLPFIDPAQSQKHVTHNDGLNIIDIGLHLSVLARNVTVPPAAPVEGMRYLLGAGATGAFAGLDGNLAAFQDGAWRFLVPAKGWRAYVEAENLLLLFDGTSWFDIGATLKTLQNLGLLGIGTAADSANPLAAKLNAALFAAKSAAEGGTGDLRFKLNKENLAKTASQIYQSGYSGRAETGLIGNDHYHIKVSADGSVWKDVLDIDPASGVVTFLSGTSGVTTQPAAFQWNGTQLRFQNPDLTWGAWTDLKGAPGSAGSAGPAGPQGPAADPAALNTAVASAQASAGSAASAAASAQGQVAILAAGAAGYSTGGSLSNNVSPAAVIGEDISGLAAAYINSDGTWDFPAQPGLRAMGTSFDASQDDPKWLFAAVGPNDQIAFGVKADGSGYIGIAAGTAPAQQTRFPDLLHVLLKGQSLAAANEAYPLLSSADTRWGNLKFTRGISTWRAADNPTAPASRSAAGFALIPMVGDLAENSANGHADHLKAALTSKYAMLAQDGFSPRILETYADTGSRRLTALSNEDTGASVIGTSATSLTIGAGSKTLTVAAGLALANGQALAAGMPMGLVNTLTGYMQGTVTAYSGTSLTVNVTAAAGAGTFAAWNLQPDTYSFPGGYYATALDDVDRAITAAKALGYSYGCGGVDWMQGERDSGGMLYETDLAALPNSALISVYSSKLKALADQFDTDIRAKITAAYPGRLVRRIPFFTYQTTHPVIGQAQLNAEAQHPHIYSFGPTYMVPSAHNSANFSNGSFWRWGSDIHLSADGQRWFGEQRAKIRKAVLFDNERWRPLRPVSAVKIDAVTVDLKLNVPRPPLVIDTSFIGKMRGWGLAVFNGSIDTHANIAFPINVALSPVSPDTLRLTFASAIPGGAMLSAGQWPQYDLGFNPAVASVGAGAASVPGGFAQYTLTITGDITAAMKPLIDEGGFYAQNGGGTALWLHPHRRAGGRQHRADRAGAGTLRRRQLPGVSGGRRAQLYPSAGGDQHPRQRQRSGDLHDGRCNLRHARRNPLSAVELAVPVRRPHRDRSLSHDPSPSHRRHVFQSGPAGVYAIAERVPAARPGGAAPPCRRQPCRLQQG